MSFNNRHKARVVDRRIRAATLLFLGDRHELLHGGGQVTRGQTAVGRLGEEGVQAEGSAFDVAPMPLPDQRMVPR